MTPFKDSVYRLRFYVRRLEVYDSAHTVHVSVIPGMHFSIFCFCVIFIKA